jgi:hypothetical protein
LRQRGNLWLYSSLFAKGTEDPEGVTDDGDALYHLICIGALFTRTGGATSPTCPSRLARGVSSTARIVCAWWQFLGLATPR